MSLVNAVLVVSGTRPRWDLDTGSSGEWGRIEDCISVGDITDPATIDHIGEAYLAPRSQPLVTHVLELLNTTGAVAGTDYSEGDTVAAPAGTLRCTEIALRLDGGRFKPTPTLNSPYEELLRRADYQVERMIAAAGGASPVSSPPTETGSGVNAGKRTPRVIDRWSWRLPEELDPEYWFDVEEEENLKAWQPATLEDPTVVTSVVIDCDFDEATGPSVFRYMVNGVAPLSIPELGSLPTDITVEADEGHAEIAMYGHNYLGHNDRPSVSCIVNGGHTNGAITMNGADPQ